MSFFAQGNADLTDKIIVAACSGLLGIAGSVLVWWLNRKRPDTVEVREVGTVSPLSVAETIRPRIEATLDGHPVAALAQRDRARA